MNKQINYYYNLIEDDETMTSEDITRLRDELDTLINDREIEELEQTTEDDEDKELSLDSLNSGF